MNVTLNNLNEAKGVLLELQQQENIHGINWNPYKVFVHCAKTIDYSMTGYPAMKPAIIRATVGKIAIRKFLSQGYMKHNLTADVAGSPEIEDTGTAHDGVATLIDTIERFQKHQDALKPHLVFGKLPKDHYEKYFAIHIADHLSEIH